MNQRNVLITNGYVVTMDTGTGDLPRADVRIADGVPRYTPDEAVTTIVMNTGPSDVDTVIVGGEIVKAGGSLVGPHGERARTLIQESNARLMRPETAA